MTPELAQKSHLSDIFFGHKGNYSDKWEHYLPIYENELGKYLSLGKAVALLEIGVQNGGSLQIWSKLLPSGSSILGIDIDAACAGLDLGDSIEVLIADAGSADALDRVLGDRAFDIIIDDGSHHSDDIQTAFTASFPRVTPGGLYIVEDLHCSYMPSMGGGLGRPGSAIEFFKLLCDGVNADHIHRDTDRGAELSLPRNICDQIARITFYDSVVVVEKAAAVKTGPFRRIMTGTKHPVADPAPIIATFPRAELCGLVLSHGCASAMGAQLLRALADARDEAGRLGELRAGALAERDAARAELYQARARLDGPEAGQRAMAANGAEGSANAAPQDWTALLDERRALRHERDAVGAERDALKRERNTVGAERDALKRERDALRAERDALRSELGQLEELRLRSDHLAARIDSLLGSTSWRITAPARLVVTAGLRIATLTGRMMKLRRGRGAGFGEPVALKALSLLANPRDVFHKLRIARQRMGSWQEIGQRLHDNIATEGLDGVLQRFRGYGSRDRTGTDSPIIASRYADIRADVERRIALQPPVPPGSDDVPDGPVISIVLPVYRASAVLLDKAIGSVIGQSYPRWELCIVDDGSGQEPLREQLLRYAAADSRIKLRLSDTNAGIAAASNMALALATGDYAGFLDHDDAMTHDALHWIALAVAEHPDTDIIYTDECKIDDSDRAHEVFCKPDWSPALMLNSMYIGHLSVYRRSLISEVGGLRSEYDFSQDYDLALRVAEGKVKVQHIDRVLYCWRATDGSAAAGDKPFARQSNIAALQDALERRGYTATALALPTANRVMWNRDSLDGRVSVIIPSDNTEHITECVQSIHAHTRYHDYEMIVVTRSSIADELSELQQQCQLHFARYDKPYNFSGKCNAGAAIAKGAYLVFVNDDVRVITEDWIEALLECVLLEGVGAAAPKLLYEDGSIQHAGLVTGVRRLIGTAFHTWPADDTSYFNLAQSLREVSSVSGACLMMRTALFQQVNGWDEVNTPIMHSDVDLCFRLGDLGYRSVYTPHATLLHKGHQSLSTYETQARGEETNAKRPVRRAKDKADIYLLRNWPALIARDPYFPPCMKGLLYFDAPQDFDIYPAEPKGAGGLDILIMSHDLTNSGAPRIVLDMATALVTAGHFVVVMSPSDGFFRPMLVEAGVVVIVEPLLCSRHDSVLDFARNFDRVIANTVVMMPAVLQLSHAVDVYWYIHESQLIADMFHHNPDFVQALHQAKQVWANSKRSWRYLAQRCQDVRIVEYGVEAPAAFQMEDPNRRDAGRVAEFIIVGSYEVRKGQDLAIAGIKLLPAKIRAGCRFSFYGRVLDHSYYNDICARAKDTPEIVLEAELTHEACRAAMQKSDAILCPSRDDSFSLVAMESIGCGTIVICTRTTGVSDYLEHEKSGFIMPQGSPEEVRDAIIGCLEARAHWPEIAARAREVLLGLFTPEAFCERIKHNLNV